MPPSPHYLKLQEQWEKRLESSSRKFKVCFEKLNGFSFKELQEFQDYLEQYMRWKEAQVEYHFASGHSLLTFKDLAYWQWFHFLCNFVENPKKQMDYDITPYKQCWWCGTKVDAIDQLYCLGTCEDKALEWRKGLKRQIKALKDPEEAYALIRKKVRKHIEKKRLPAFVYRLNALSRLEALQT